MSIQLSTRRKN